MCGCVNSEIELFKMMFSTRNFVSMEVLQHQNALKFEMSINSRHLQYDVQDHAHVKVVGNDKAACGRVVE